MDRPRQSFGRSGERPIGRRDDVYDEVETAEPRERRNQMMAMNIKYTTAASQFLYGKSVVKAALEQGRRKLYKLFIYGGENRKDSKDNAIITRLAERRGVPIEIIPNEDQRLMDKMSMGRPHNGFVLETSPLPRLPVKSLGRLEETLGKLGFHVELDHQSREEEAINGQDTFIPRKNNNAPKPFVLLLNEILDPGNLGGILRTASYFGVDAVGITNRSSSTLTPVVLKSAAGAVEEITIFSVDSPVSFIEESRKHGWKTYAAVAPPDPKLAQRHGDKFISTATVEAEQPLTKHPSILVLGNEGHGLSKPIKVAADYELSVPYFVGNSCVDSLNVSVAAGLLCHAFVRAPPIVKQTAPKLEEEASTETKSATEKEDGQDGKETLF
ncbi:alpha/beta knot [Trichoderma citrinoviride]|uniref:rRNA methyltransferase 1, mitochondrial n=1 Tax=Trichoderma citrinoviride TaxID=58853 RepID=A0A2T4BK92_9HYPO|nr:alpha/beta knot [Trichoderma citrinoviride]PTB69734.1 alpha/beta knot [Trichoderma citrinoviride]